MPRIAPAAAAAAHLARQCPPSACPAQRCPAETCGRKEVGSPKMGSQPRWSACNADVCIPPFAQAFLCSPHQIPTSSGHWLETGFSAPPCAALAAARRFGRCWWCPMRPAVQPCSKHGSGKMGGIRGPPAGHACRCWQKVQSSAASWRGQPTHRLACWWRSTSKHSGGCRKTQRSAYRQKPRECQCLHTGASGSASAGGRAASAQLRCLHERGNCCCQC